MPSLRKRRWIAVAGVAAIVASAIAWLRFGPSPTPAGQPPLERLDASSLPIFREAFNAHAGARRLLVLLSPT